MNSKALTLAKIPVNPVRHESASTTADYWRRRYPALLATMSAATGKAVSEVADILVTLARTPFAHDGAVTLRFMQEHVA